MHENVIEFLKGDQRAMVTFSQGRFVSKIQQLAESHPNDVQIEAVNKDGSICAWIPVNWIKIQPKREVSEEERQRLQKQAHKNFGTYR